MKCVIGGCVRNCEQYLYAVFQNIKKIENLFDETQIIIAYDKSNDNSLLILSKLRIIFPNLTILLNDKPLTDIRTVNIANARNRILDEINKKYMDYDFMILIDCDDVCSKPINIDKFEPFLKSVDWDVLSFNIDGYYDVWALSIKPYLYSCWHFNKALEVVNIMRDYVINKLKNMNKDELLECVSAFGGFAIYRLNKIKGCKYNGIFDINLFETEFLEENKEILKDNLINKVDDCEHRSFHVQMINKNNAKIRISPQILFE